MRAFQWPAVLLLASFPVSAEQEGCGRDTDCKGDRICVTRECVSPLEPVGSRPQWATPAGSGTAPRVGPSEGTPRSEKRFGSQGQFVPFGSISVTYASASASGPSASATDISISPTFYVFVANNVAIGLATSVTFSSLNNGTSSASESAFGIAPILAFNLWLGESASVVPAFSVYLNSRDLQASSSGNNPRLTTVGLQLAMPILFHPVQHFFLGFGPAVSFDIAAGLANATGEAPKTIAIGVRSYLGGYF